MQLSEKLIVLAEDELFLRKSVKRNLELEGGKVLDAPDGKVAWEIIKTNKPDVIVSDFKMPAVNGLELLQLMREAKMDTPFIFITGFASETHKHMLDAGAYAVLPKPFDSDKLVKAIVEALNAKDSVQKKVI